MLKSLFKPSWKSGSVEKRLAYIAEADISAKQSILKTLASDDIDASVRRSAMSKVTDLQFLFNLWQSNIGAQSNAENTNNTGKVDNADNVDNVDNSIGKQAEVAFRHLLQSETHSLEDFKTFMHNNPKSHGLMLKYCPNDTVRDELLQGLSEAEQAELISDITYSQSRIKLAEQLSDISALEVARKNLKGKDKNAEKIIRSKIDAFHAAEKKEAENTALTKSIREQMESLSRYVAWSDEIKTKFFKLTEQWDGLDFEPTTDEKEKYQTAFTQVSADVKHHIAITDSQKNKQVIVNKLEKIASDVAEYSLTDLLTNIDDISNKLNDLASKWNKESEIILPVDDTRNRFVVASDSIESCVSICEAVDELCQVQSNPAIEESRDQIRQAKNLIAVIKKSSWSKSYPKLLSATEASLEAESIIGASKDARKEAKASLDKLHKRINRIFGIAKRGDAKRAQRELQSVIKASSQYEGIERKKLDERIESLTLEVDKMGDWKDFAIEPKLIELCEKMEQLPELERQSKNPSADKLASRIKSLQEEWKALGSSDVSDLHWPRFKEAGDKAYEPCSEFFKQRREIQAQNLEKREPCIQQMKELFESTDWENKPDYKAVEERVSQIMQQWKKIKDVDRGRGQKQWLKLSKYKDQVSQKLDVQYDKNIGLKHSLIEQMNQLLETDINEQSLSKLQFLQGKWKQVGITPRNKDQKAWLKFKAASDDVYQKIQELRQEKRSEVDEHIDVYKQLHSQIHELAKTTQDLSVSDKEFEVLLSQYKELPELPAELPEKLVERLEIDFNRACDAYVGAKDRLNQEKLDNELLVLAAKAEICAELEQLEEGADDAKVKALEDKINDLEIQNKSYLKQFEERLSVARNPNREAYGQARRMLLIDYEILLDVESPKEDKDLRLQVQLEKMTQQGIGNAPINKSVLIDEIKLKWLCMPGAEAKLQKEFDSRFKRLNK